MGLTRVRYGTPSVVVVLEVRSSLDPLENQGKGTIVVFRLLVERSFRARS